MKRSIRVERGVLLVAILATLSTSPGWAQAGARESGAARAAVDAAGFTGTVLVLHLGAGDYEAGHAERADRRLIPASTFKIFNSLVALETGAIADTSSVIAWDGVTRERTELNRDLDLATAFRISAVPHYQELARRIGPDRMQEYIDAAGYGNGDISGGIDQFWLSGGLRISPREQVDFLARLYRGDLPFSERTMGLVRGMMIFEQPGEYVLSAKTGWAVLPGDENVGWWVGWVDRGSEVHVFATALEATAPGEAFGPARQAVTREALTGMGILP